MYIQNIEKRHRDNVRKKDFLSNDISTFYILVAVHLNVNRF